MSIDLHVSYLEKLEKHIRRSHEFKSLRYKTQVLNLGVEQPEQKLTNRLEHSEQVAKCAASLVRGVGGNPEEITMAYVMGLSHDLGHVAFGHAGESTLNDLLKRKGEQGFSHSAYGAMVFDKLVDEYCIEREEEIKEYMPEEMAVVQEEITYLQEKKGEMCEGIRNHSQYYANSVNFYTTEEEKLAIEKSLPNATKENLVGNCVRLADSIAYMCSDMHDLIMAKFDNGKSVVSMKEAEEFIQSLENYPHFDKLQGKRFLENILKGQHGVKKIQEKICEEVSRQSPQHGRLETISDEYKYTRVIKAGLEGAKENPEKLKNYLPIKDVEAYDRFKQENDGYQGLTEEEKNTLKSAKEKKDKLENALQVIENYYVRNGIEKQENAERSHLWCTKPMLATVFEIQDQKQYNEIILPKKTVRFRNNIVETRKDMEAVFHKYVADGERLLQTGGKASDEVLNNIPISKEPAVNYAVAKIHGLTNKTFKEEVKREVGGQEKKESDKPESRTGTVKWENHVVDKMQEIFAERGSISEAVDNVREATGNVADNVREVIGNAADRVREVTGNVVDSAREVTGNVADSVREVTGNVADNVREATGNVVDSVREVVGNVVDSAREATGNVVDSVREVTGNVVDSVREATDNTASSAKELLTNLTDKQSLNKEAGAMVMPEKYRSMEGWKEKINEKRAEKELNWQNTYKKQEHIKSSSKARGE